MKHLLFITGLFVLLTSSISAQDLTWVNFSIGPRIGLNLSNLTNSDNTEVKPGMVIGVTSTYSITETSGITFDILYSQEGTRTNFDPQVKTNLNYLRLLAAYNQFFGELGESFRPKLYIGPALGFLTSAETKIGDNETDIKEGFNSIDLSLVGGIGFNYRIGKRQWLNVDGRYFLGLTDVADNRPANQDPVNNQNIQISVGVAFGIGK